MGGLIQAEMRELTRCPYVFSSKYDRTILNIVNRTTSSLFVYCTQDDLCLTKSFFALPLHYFLSKAIISPVHYQISHH